MTPGPASRGIAGLLLGAGLSRRMPEGNKLLMTYQGVPLVRFAATALCDAGLGPVVAVLGHEAEIVEAALSGLPLIFACNPAPEDGIGASLACGIAALPSGVDGVVVALGDMPKVRAGHVSTLLDAFAPEAGAAICQPVFDGQPGHPVLFAARFFAELASLVGDVGAREVIARHADSLRLVPADSAAVLLDVDRPADLDNSCA